MIKKILSGFVMFSFLFMPFCFSSENIKNKKINSAEKNFKNSVSLSKQYSHFYSLSPYTSADDIVKKIYDLNNKYSFLKFYNYPMDKAVFIYKSNYDNYGFIKAKDNSFDFYKPEYKKIYFADMYSMAFRWLNLSYDFNLYNLNNNSADNSYAIYSNFDMDEDVEIKNDNIIFTYKGHNENYQSKIIKLHNKNGFTSNKLKAGALDSLDKIYKTYYSYPKFIGYPQKAMQVYVSGNKKGIAFYDGNLIKKIPAVYDDFLFDDMNSVIYQTLNLSFSSQDRILAKKNGKWGIIDSDNETIADFKYDKINIFYSKSFEEHSFSKGDYFTYKNLNIPRKDIILAQAGDKFGVINYNGDILMKFKNRSSGNENKLRIGIDELEDNCKIFEKKRSNKNKNILPVTEIKGIYKDALLYLPMNYGLVLFINHYNLRQY